VTARTRDPARARGDVPEDDLSAARATHGSRHAGEQLRLRRQVAILQWQLDGDAEACPRETTETLCTGSLLAIDFMTRACPTSW